MLVENNWSLSIIFSANIQPLTLNNNQAIIIAYRRASNKLSQPFRSENLIKHQ